MPESPLQPGQSDALNEKALEAAARQLMPFGVNVPLEDREQVIAETRIDAEAAITAYFDSLAEQGVVLVDANVALPRTERLRASQETELCKCRLTCADTDPDGAGTCKGLPRDEHREAEARRGALR